MKLNLIGPFIVNAPYGTEIAFAKGLKQLGHAVNEIDPNIDTDLRGVHNDADATLVFKTCCGAEKYLRSLKHPVIVYQPDDARFTHIRESIIEMRQYADLFLSFDDYGAKFAKSVGYRAAETLLLTADPELYSPSPEPIERDIDISFIGNWGDEAAHQSRRKMMQVIHQASKKHGWTNHWEMTKDIPHIVDIYRRSKVVVNHATDVGQAFGYGFGLQCRHFEVGMTKTALLSNTTIGSLGYRSSYDLSCDDSTVREWNAPLYQQFNSEETLIAQLERMLHESWEHDGEILHTHIQSKHMPVHRAQRIVSFVERYSK